MFGITSLQTSNVHNSTNSPTGPDQTTQIFSLRRRTNKMTFICGHSPKHPEVELGEGERQYWFCRPDYPEFSIWDENPWKTPSLVSNPGVALPEYEWAETGGTEGKWLRILLYGFLGWTLFCEPQSDSGAPATTHTYLATSPKRGSYSAKADSEMFLSLASLVLLFLLNLAHCLWRKGTVMHVSLIQTQHFSQKHFTLLY